MSLWDYIVWPFARLMEFLYNWTQNYGVSVILFALVVNLILLPFMAKSKKSMMRTTRFQPKMKALEKKYADNKEKYQQEVAKLYREEGINPMSGCLWSLLPFPIIIALYSVIRQPLEKMMGISSEGVKKITEWAAQNAGFVSTNKTYDEIGVTDALHQHWDAAVNALGDLADKLMNLDYSFLGMNLGAVPNWKVWTIDFANTSTALPALGLFLIPLIAALLSWLSVEKKPAHHPPRRRCTGRGIDEDNEYFHAHHVDLDLLHHACRSRCILDRKQHFRYNQRCRPHQDLQEKA